VLEVSPARRRAALESPSRARKVLLELFHRSATGLGVHPRSGQFVLGQMYVDDALSEPTTLHTPTGDFTFATKDFMATSTREMSQRLMVFTSVTIGRSRSRRIEERSNDPGIHRRVFSRLLETKYGKLRYSRSRARRNAGRPDADAVKSLVGDGWEVLVQRGAGELAHFNDASYVAVGATIADAPTGEVNLRVNPPTLPEVALLPKDRRISRSSRRSSLRRREGAE